MTDNQDTNKPSEATQIKSATSDKVGGKRQKEEREIGVVALVVIVVIAVILIFAL